MCYEKKKKRLPTNVYIFPLFTTHNSFFYLILGTTHKQERKNGMDDLQLEGAVGGEIPASGIPNSD